MENRETQTGLEKMDFKTADGIDANIEKLAQIFPEAVTETKDANGKLVRVASLEALKTLLEGKVADPNEQECYEFIWPGKSDAIMEAAKSITKTLRPCPEESKNWDSTQNLYIEGDNLEALKLLQQSYLGKVKMIYIDPPYNTGKDFVYRDNFHKSKSEYDEESTVRDEDDNKLVQNTESNGRFHSDWCSMIYPRLKLARDLLSDDGVIFISIDDHEIHNLRKICDEIFGEDNFVADLIWLNKEGGGSSDSKLFRIKHEHILCFSKNIELIQIKGIPINNEDRYKGIDEYYEQRGPYYLQKLGMGSIQYSKSLDYPIIAPDNSVIMPADNNSGKKACWRWSKDKYEKNYERGFIVIKRDSSKEWTVYTKQYLKCDNDGNTIDRRQRPMGIINDFSSTQASKYLESISIKFFNYSKPKELIKYLIDRIVTEKSIILDFFSGSATTAHACMQLNAEDGGNRKFIMVQLPEKTDEKSEAFKAGYKNICEIGKERIRRAGEKIKAEHATTAPNLDIGFRVLKVAESNMKDVYYSPAQTSQDLLDSLESNIKDDRTDLDLLFACLIDFGVELSLPLKSETIDGVSVHTVQSGEIPDIIACFAENIPESVVREMASRQPLRAVFRDSSFKDSPSKINVKEIFKYHSPNTTIKVL